MSAVNPFAATTINSGESAPLNIWRGAVDGDGQPIYLETSYDDYGTAPRGEYQLRITGLREPRENANKFAGPDEPQTKTITAIEFEVTAGPLAGTRFLIDFLTLNLSSGGGKFSPSNLYRIFIAACPEGGTGVGDMIGGELTAYLTQKIGDDGTPKYMKMTYDTCAPVEPGQAQAGIADDGVPAAFRRK